MLILFLNVVHYDIKPFKADHVQPKTPLFTSGSQHPPRFGHAVYLGGDANNYQQAKQEISLKKIFGGSQILTILTQLSNEIPLYSLSLHAGKGCSV